MRNIITILLLQCFYLTAQVVEPIKENKVSNLKSESLQEGKLDYKIIKVKNNTYGYDIYVNDQVLIHQTTVPGMPGIEGFSSEAAAEKVAKLVVGKIKKGEMPPSVSIQEMQIIKAIP